MGKFFYYDYEKEPSGRKRVDFICGCIETILEREGNQTPLKILDYGCGNGNISLAMSHAGNVEVLGIDIDHASVRRATSNAENAGRENVSFRCCNLDGLRDDEEFDLIICCELLEHLHDPSEMLACLMRKLKHEGHIIITVPNGYAGLEVINQLILRKNPMQKMLVKLKDSQKRRFESSDNIQTSNVTDSHKQFFSFKKISELIENGGLRIMVVMNSNFCFGFGFLWYVLLRNIVKNDTTLFKKIDTLDCALANIVPRFLSGGWYFLCQKKETHSGE